MAKFRIGDKVIVDKVAYGKWGDKEEEMDEWVGTTMTIVDVDETGPRSADYEMEEDDGEWVWAQHVLRPVGSKPKVRKVRKKKVVKERFEPVNIMDVL